MNPFLEELFDKAAIDAKYLESYLSPIQWQYLESNLQSIEDLDNNLYTDDEGESLEVLLQFLVCHKDDITVILREPSRKEILMVLYTSSVISGNYDCFRVTIQVAARGARQPPDFFGIVCLILRHVYVVT